MRLRFLGPVLALFSAGLAASATACAPDPAASLVLAVDTDMSAPTEIVALSIGVYNEKGVTLLSPPQTILDDRAAYQLRFPATLRLDLTKGADTTSNVRVVVIGYTGEISKPATWRASVFQDFRATVPTTDARILHVHLSRLDAGTASGSYGKLQDSPKDVVLASGPEACEASQPPLDGVCRPPRDVVGDDVNKLPIYSAAQIYGGGSGPDDKGSATCWDASACFGGATPLTLVDDGAGCAAAIPASINLDKMTIGLLRPEPKSIGAAGNALATSFDDAAKAALCNGSNCYVVLDGANPATKTVGTEAATVDTANRRLSFPPSVCKMLRGQRTLSTGEAIVSGVAVTDRCPRKVVETPLCAPWALDKSVVKAIAPL
jgi:hypothetical protein